MKLSNSSGSHRRADRARKQLHPRKRIVDCCDGGRRCSTSQRGAEAPTSTPPPPSRMRPASDPHAPAKKPAKAPKRAAKAPKRPAKAPKRAAKAPARRANARGGRYHGVQRIVAARTTLGANGTLDGGAEYLIKWRGCSISQCSWEPEENLTPDLVAIGREMLAEF